MNALSKSDPVALKQRLAGLSAGQRALLARRLGEDKSEAASTGESRVIPRAQPLRVEEHPCAAVYPASRGQQRMWFLHHYAPESPVYCSPSAFHLVGPLNVAWLETAFGAVIQRHDMLRTTFAMENGELFQRVAVSSAFQLRQINLEAIPADIRNASAERCLAEEACRPFDLAAGPPFRAVLIRLQPTEHVLLVVLHHIISDGWSRSNFYRELSMAYGALATGRRAPMRDLPIQFADYSAWQEDWLEGGALKTQTAYWKTKLAGELEPLELPSDRARPATESFRGGRCSRRLDPQLTTALETRAQEEGATFFMILLAAFKTLLHRYTGHDDLIVGVPIANRQRVEVEGLIGFFANTLVMRTTFPDDLTFRELLRRVKETAVEAYTNQDMPFERLVELLQVRRDASRTPLFQVTFALQDFPEVVLELPGIETSPWFVTTHTSKFDFSLTLERSAEGWTAVAEYSADLFNADRVERMLEHWRVILENVVANPIQRVSEIPLLTAAERHQVLVEWNRTERDYPRDKCVHQLFEEQVERTPDGVAVVFEGQSLTYRKLNARANQLGHHLRSLGVGPDVLVGLCVERSLEMVVALLAILKAGGAYVPLDPGYPRERLALMLNDAQAQLLLTQKNLADNLPAHEAKVICLNDLPEAALSSQPATNPTNLAAPANLCYVIFTSGSTGRPKGAMVPQRAIVNHLLWMQERFPVTPEDAVLQKTPLSFDGSVWEVFLPLLTGARLVLARQDGHRDPADLVNLIQQERVTTVTFVPSLLEWFVECPGVADCVSLRRVFSGGEALSLDLCRRVFERLAVELVNLYGPTETTIDASYWVCERSDTRSVAPLGRPWANTQLYVLDSQLQPVAIGVAGELFIGGTQVGRGYWNDPEMTALKFVPDPFSADPQARLFRSGDRCRWGPDGNVEFLGRLDHQVKIRGFRIELGEIEAVLGGHPDLSGCAVVTQNESGGGKALAAFVVGREQSEMSIGTLRQWLGEKLPDYMIPSRFSVLPILPLTPNEKVDRQALQKMDGVELAAATEYVPPRNDLESKLAEIWQDVLRRDLVGIHDNFFELGGHSLLAVAICAQITQWLHVEVPVRCVFEHPTIAGMSKQMASLGEQMQNTRPIEKPRGQEVYEFPLSFAQQRLWFLDRFEGGGAAYHIPGVVRLLGNLNRDALERAINEIVARHESLRTHFAELNGQPVQVVVPALKIALPIEDLSALEDRARETAIAAVLLRELERPLKLSQDPLLRMTLVKLSEREHLLLRTFHHIVSDGWSVGVFNRELTALYAAFCKGRRSPLEPLPIQYPDYAVWQRQFLQGAELERQLSYWRKQLANAPTLKLRTDRPRPAKLTYAGARHAFTLSPSLSARLKDFNQRGNITPFMSLLAAFQVLMARYSGQDDILVGTPIANRQRRELENLIGFFANTLVLRTDLSGQPGFGEVAARVRKASLDAYEHQDLPFQKLVEDLHPERDLSRHLLFQVTFALQNAPAHPLALAGIDVTSVHSPAVSTHFDLELSLRADGDSWAGSFSYNTDLLDTATIQRMEAHYQTLLATMLAEPERSVWEVPMLSAAERQQILVEWNRTEREYPRDKCVHQLFEEQVERTPDAVAVVFEGKSLTYRELNLRANQLAHYLRSLGVGPEVLVGLCVERSLEMVVALLGILKAGGAYVPLDLEYPRDRLAFMLEDSQARVLLTQKKHAADLPAHEAKVICLDDPLQAAMSSQPETNPANQTASTNLAYVIYTSGSTGTPKGVMAVHHGITRLVCNTDYIQLDTTDCVAQVSNPSFDAATFEIWGALVNGSRLTVMPREVTLSPPHLADELRRGGISTLFLTTALFNEVVRARPGAFAGLKQVLFGGETVDPHWVGESLRAGSPQRMLHMYGPTETTTFATWHPVEAVASGERTIPIGRPIGNTQVYVLDRYLNPAPVGVAGELYIGGDGLARGYLNRPELTAERFVSNPFATEPGARLYGTGDLVRYLPDGNIEFLGRLDDQVKIRGFRIELGEIETVLREAADVSEAVVSLRQDATGEKRLVAYVVASGNREPDQAGLKAALKARLPDYMIPAHVEFLSALPLTPNGKVDRRALPKPTLTAAADSGEVMPPRNLLELQLIQLWRGLFQREDIGRQDNFFELGGHSLLAARLATEIDKLLGCKLPIAALFQSPTVESLTRRLTRENWAPPWSSLVPLQPLGSQPPLFFVHGVGGNVYGFLELAKLLPSDQPSYGIQAVGLDGNSARHVTVEDMAAHYVKEILSFQRDGPFYLAGYSMGGLIAFEMARQLHRLGQRVAVLALLDSAPIGKIPWVAYGLSMSSYIPRRCLFHFRHWWELPRRERLNYFRGRWAALRYWIVRNRSKPPLVSVPLREDGEPPQVPGFYGYYHVIASAYRVHPYPGSVDLFVSDQTNDEINPRWRWWYWRYLARGGVSFHRVPGMHHQLLEPGYLPALAKALGTVLHRAQEKERATHSRNGQTHANLVS